MMIFLFFDKRFGEIQIHFSDPAGTLEFFFWVFFRDTDPEPRAPPPRGPGAPGAQVVALPLPAQPSGVAELVSPA